MAKCSQSAPGVLHWWVIRALVPLVVTSCKSGWVVAWLDPVMPDPALPAICVAGTYDGGIVGWETTGGSSPTFRTVFAFTPHQGSVRALAIPHEGNKAGQLLVSGGADEHIRLYDLRRRAETGELLYHKGTVTCLTFIGSTHLLSAGEDGIVCIWRVHDWSLLHILGGHKGPVDSLAVHPSGKLALSGGRDRTLRLWDLVNGRCAYIQRLEGAVSQVEWSPKAACYAILLNERVLQVRDASDNRVMASYEHPQRVTAMVFLSDDTVVAATEDLQLCRISTGGEGGVSTRTSISARVKDFHIVKGGVLAAFSDGRVSFLREGNLEAAGSVSIGDGVRIISLAGYAPGHSVASTSAAAKVSKAVSATSEGSERPQHRTTDVTGSKKGKKRHRKHEELGISSLVQPGSESGDNTSRQGEPRKDKQKKKRKKQQQKSV